MKKRVTKGQWSFIGYTGTAVGRGIFGVVRAFAVDTVQISATSSAKSVRIENVACSARWTAFSGQCCRSMNYRRKLHQLFLMTSFFPGWIMLFARAFQRRKSRAETLNFRAMDQSESPLRTL